MLSNFHATKIGSRGSQLDLEAIVREVSNSPFSQFVGLQVGGRSPNALHDLSAPTNADCVTSQGPSRVAPRGDIHSDTKLCLVSRSLVRVRSTSRAMCSREYRCGSAGSCRVQRYGLRAQGASLSLGPTNLATVVLHRALLKRDILPKRGCCKRRRCTTVVSNRVDKQPTVREPTAISPSSARVIVDQAESYEHETPLVPRFDTCKILSRR